MGIRAYYIYSIHEICKIMFFCETVTWYKFCVIFINVSRSLLIIRSLLLMLTWIWMKGIIFI